jgi:nucleoside-diphosphate-sugar epimerase
MRAFITGATGFIGGRLAAHLAEKGHAVTALARPTSDTRALERMGAHIIEGDVLKPDTYRNALRSADWVFHAAAIVDVIKPDRRRLLETNIDGTRRFLGACANAEVGRVIHFSSIAALGHVTNGPADETHELKPPYASAYEESKHRSDAAAEQFARQGLDVVRILPSIVIGYGDPKSGAVFRRFLLGRVPPLPRTQGIASYVHVDDLVDGVMLATRKGRSGERYIFTQANWTHEELYTAIAEIAGIKVPNWHVPMAFARLAALVEESVAALRRKPPRFSRQTLRSLANRHAFSSKKARTQLGWTPEDFRKRLEQTIRAYQEEAHVAHKDA